MKIAFEFDFEANANPHTIAKALRAQAEALSKGSEIADDGCDQKQEYSDTEVKTMAKKKVKAAAPVDDFEDDSSFEEETEEVEELATVKKKAAKPKAPTSADVNAACKAKATAVKLDGGNGVKAVQAILKKFKVASVSELDESQYPAVIKALEV